ncbi:hypothetical protein E4T47_05964 [Aureobasidium subglaciale]|nr:hypothetical protein E4T47_05964 [Aureobasidium subglaciale]
MSEPPEGDWAEDFLAQKGEEGWSGSRRTFVVTPTEQVHPKHTRSQSRRQREPSRTRSKAWPSQPSKPSVLRRSSLYDKLKNTVVPELVSPLIIIMLAFTIWSFPSVAFFWHPAAGVLPSLDRISENIPRYLDLHLPRQLCNIAVARRLLSCPDPIERQHEPSSRQQTTATEKWREAYTLLSSLDFVALDAKKKHSSSAVDRIHQRTPYLLRQTTIDQSSITRYIDMVEAGNKQILSHYDAISEQLQLTSRLHSSWSKLFYPDVPGGPVWLLAKSNNEIQKLASSAEHLEHICNDQLNDVLEMLASTAASHQDTKRPLFHPRQSNPEGHHLVIGLRKAIALLGGSRKDLELERADMVESQKLLQGDKIGRQQAGKGERPKILEEHMEGIRRHLQG